MSIPAARNRAMSPTMIWRLTENFPARAVALMALSAVRVWAMICLRSSAFTPATLLLDDLPWDRAWPVSLVVGQQVVLDVPQLLGQVHIVVVGVVKALDLVPQCLHLCLAVALDLVQGGHVIDQLAV